jgi:hypothetical protein
MSYKKHMAEYLNESKEDRLAQQFARPGIEVWPYDDDALWVLRHSDPARSVICSTREFADSPFCGTGSH